MAEDTATTLEGLRAAGCPEDILAALDCVTRRGDETYEAFIGRIAPSELARRVKLADLADNMDLSRLPAVTEKDLIRMDRYKAA